MQDFIYKFDYEDPRAAARNRDSDQRDYFTTYLKIRANREADALAWGRVLADWLVMHLFDDPRPGRWSETIGADELWSELPRYRTPVLDRIWASEAIATGEYPDVGALMSLLNLRR